MSSDFPQSTSASLLVRLRCAEDQRAWTRFVELYTPFFIVAVKRLGIKGDRADDMVQEIFLHLVKVLPAFRYDHTRRFRGWLWKIICHKVYDRPIDDAADAACRPDLDLLAQSDPLEEWVESEYREQLVAQALRIIQGDFSESTWQAFWEYVCRNRPAAQVAAELNVSLATVYQAKSRVLQRLRQELDVQME